MKGAGEGEKPQLRRNTSKLTLTDSASASACMICWDLGKQGCRGAEALAAGGRPERGGGSYHLSSTGGVQVVKTSALYLGAPGGKEWEGREGVYFSASARRSSR